MRKLSISNFKKIMKYAVLMLTTYLLFSAPASAATLQDIMNKAKEVLSSGKDLAIVLGYVVAVICIIVAGLKLKAKAEGDQQVKMYQIIGLFCAAIILGGGAFWVQTTADSLGVEIQSNI
ncbi:MULTISPECIES: TrbC/VirB2 family protein [Enterobacteriaceae]|uniref:TrbC/VirB2 family protein n=1 Tax=Enterobacteriaceae TaxID=543 RepID=UPI002B285466|nr:hypothetical protein R0Q77_27785 [Citrobacter braakii]